MSREFKTALAKVKGLGSAKEGSNHWLYQRLSSVILIPLTIWFVITLLRLFQSDAQEHFIVFASPFNLLCFTLFIGFSLYHGALGMQVIIEDYVHNKLWKRIILFFIFIISIISAVGVIGALLIYHIAVFNVA